MGLFIEHNKVFYLKGILSSFLFDRSGNCDTSNFVIYTNVFKFTEWIKNPLKCGKMSVSASLIQGGLNATREYFPWTVAVVNKAHATENHKTYYLKTGTLISERHVLVSTSFVVFSPKGDLKPAENFKMYFGIFKLKDMRKSDVVSTGVSKIVTHENYNRERLPKEANIAILFADESINFSDKVQPACLPTHRDSPSDIIGSSGYIVGWGFDETATFSMNKKMLNMKVDDKDKCVAKWKNRTAAVKHSKFFCASPTKSGFPSTADGPFYIKLEDSWTFRGWLAIKGDSVGPFVFEDIAFYSPWIENKIKT